jgi:hypothetical protein
MIPDAMFWLGNAPIQRPLPRLPMFYTEVAEHG